MKYLYNLSTTLNLQIRNLRAQAYDGASNILGCKSGVATKLSEMQPEALATDCQGHFFNLGIKNSMHNSMIMKDVLGNVSEIITFIKCSSKREHVFEDIKDLKRFESEAIEENQKIALNTDKL